MASQSRQHFQHHRFRATTKTTTPAKAAVAPKKISPPFAFQQQYHHPLRRRSVLVVLDTIRRGSEAIHLNRRQHRHRRSELFLFRASKTGNKQHHYHEYPSQQNIREKFSSLKPAQEAERATGGGRQRGGEGQKSVIMAGTTKPTKTASCCSPLSMSLDDLSVYLQGRGRAQAIWDCYRAGIDPFWYYDSSSCFSTTTKQQQRHRDGSMKILGTSKRSHEEQQKHNGNNENITKNLIEQEQQQYDRASKWILECKNSSDNRNKKTNNSYNNNKKRSQQQKLPLQLGMTAYKLLQERFNGPLEEKVGKIEHYTVSKDSTIKLLIKLQRDQLLVETVLIPDIYKSKKTEKTFHESIHTTNNTTNSAISTTRTKTITPVKATIKIPATLCVSSQVGCAQGCTFCQTGRMGRKRSLTADEILVQVVSAVRLMRADTRKMLRDESRQQSSGDSSIQATTGYTMMEQQAKHQQQQHDYFLDNVVFMGMGEPADNIDNVVIAVNRLVNEFHIPPKKITVSTIGTTPMSFMELASKVKAVIAWSVHAVNDLKRSQLVPTTRYSMVELRQGLMDAILLEQQQHEKQQNMQQQKQQEQQQIQLHPLFIRSRRMRVVMIEVVLIDGINDSIQDAFDLGHFCLPLVVQKGENGGTKPTGIRLIINLIPFNDMGGSSGGDGIGRGYQQQLQHRPEYHRPSSERVIAFQNVLLSTDFWSSTAVDGGGADGPFIESCGSADAAITAYTASHHPQKTKELPWRCYIRTTRGDDTSAACGQLVTTIAKGDQHHNNDSTIKNKKDHDYYEHPQNDEPGHS